MAKKNAQMKEPRRRPDPLHGTELLSGQTPTKKNRVLGLNQYVYDGAWQRNANPAVHRSTRAAPVAKATVIQHTSHTPDTPSK